MQKKKVDQKAFDSNFTAQSMDIGPGHKGAMKGKKIYDKYKGTDNKHERDAFEKKTGALLPKLAKKKSPKKYG